MAIVLIYNLHIQPTNSKLQTYMTNTYFLHFHMHESFSYPYFLYKRDHEQDITVNNT